MKAQPHYVGIAIYDLCTFTIVFIRTSQFFHRKYNKVLKMNGPFTSIFEGNEKNIWTITVTNHCNWWKKKIKG